MKGINNQIYILNELSKKTFANKRTELKNK
jgi:hypothetical protein